MCTKAQATHAVANTSKTPSTQGCTIHHRQYSALLRWLSRP